MADRHLETAWWGPPPNAAPTLVLLHEGLGCVSLWRNFPQRLAEATGSIEDPRRIAIVLIAPHFFTEDTGLAAIAAISATYGTGLQARLARHHAHADNAFHGWSGAWLNPDFRAWNILDRVANIRVPMQLLQGLDDEYGTTEQVYAAVRTAPAQSETMILEGVGHAPHLEKPDATLDAIARFVKRVL